MSGLNVAYDSLVSTAHSGVIGGLVIYVADDPGANAGMVEQDSRGFALMSDLPMLDPVSVQDAYDLTRARLRPLGSHRLARLRPPGDRQRQLLLRRRSPRRAASAWPERQPLLIRDINVYTKAGAVIAMTQHRDVIARLEKAGVWIAERGLNELRIANQRIARRRTKDEGRRERYAITQSRNHARHHHRRHHRRVPRRGVRDREPLRLRPGDGLRAADRQRASAADRADPDAASALRHDPGAGGAGADHRERRLHRGAADGLGGQDHRQAERPLRARGRVRRASHRPGPGRRDRHLPSPTISSAARPRRRSWRRRGRSPSARAARIAAPSWPSTRPSAAPASRRTR